MKSNFRKAALVLMAGWVVVGCTAAPLTDERPTLGGDDDPVLALARQALGPSADSVTLTISNNSGYDFSSGLITLQPTFTVNTAPSTALLNYTKGTSSTAGNPTVFASALGLTVGTNAFIVPLIKNNKSQAVTVTVASNAKLYFIAHVDGAVDDFVALNDISVAGGAVTANLLGYDPDDGAGATVGLGNATTGANPSSTTLSIKNNSDCPAGMLSTKSTLHSDNFATGSGSSAWPANAGYAADFGGDWYTDGISARLYNPNWGGSTGPIPTTSGFVKFIDLCPAAGSTVSMSARVVTDYTEPASDTTLVLYFFDRGGTLLGVTASHTQRAKNDRTFALYDVAIPSAARTIAAVPMAYLAAAEKGTVYYKNYAVTYEPANTYTTRSLMTDAFSNTSNGSSGKAQPTGWTEFGGDWFVLTPQNWGTLWNSTWGGDQTKLPPIDTGITKSVALGSYVAGDVLSARLFAATTFTDPTSFARLRLVPNTGAAIESDRLSGGYGNIEVRRAAIPTGATSVTVIINVYLGPTEKSSLYVDDLSVSVQHLN